MLLLANLFALSCAIRRFFSVPCSIYISLSILHYLLCCEFSYHIWSGTTKNWNCSKSDMECITSMCESTLVRTTQRAIVQIWTKHVCHFITFKSIAIMLSIMWIWMARTCIRLSDHAGWANIYRAHLWSQWKSDIFRQHLFLLRSTSRVSEKELEKHKTTDEKTIWKSRRQIRRFFFFCSSFRLFFSYSNGKKVLFVFVIWIANAAAAAMNLAVPLLLLVMWL